jgi:hypothetical protein
MNALIVSLVIFFSWFSTAILSYISMAVPIGPWIASTIVFACTFVLRIIGVREDRLSQIVSCVVIGSSIGGIVATAMGFSLPTLYFLDKQLFDTWMSHRSFFVFVVSGLAFVAGLFGFWFADVVENRLLDERNLQFPISQLIYRMISARHYVKKSREMIVGFWLSLFLCFLQDGFGVVRGCVAKSVLLVQDVVLIVYQVTIVRIDEVRLDLSPLFWAIGFVTGEVIAFPLLLGAVTRFLIMDPINSLCCAQISRDVFTLAFCSGIVVSGALDAIIALPSNVFKIFNKMLKRVLIGKMGFAGVSVPFVDKFFLPFFVIVVALVSAYLSLFKFSVLSIVYLMIFSIACIYQIVTLAGRTGMAFLGRFATFVMIPGIFIFNLNYVQAMLIAAFVELSGGVATDIIMGRKLGKLMGIDRSAMRKLQFIGLFSSCAAIGLIFFILIKQLGLGSPDLFAQRAQARALLINARSFDMYVLFAGITYGYILKRLKINPILVFGGLLMPLNTSLSLVVGGALSRICKNKDRWYPFWSGVFAASSLWIIIRSVMIKCM